MVAHPGFDETGLLPMHPPECAPQPVFVSGNNDDVDMVGHQTTAPDFRPRPTRRIARQIEIERIVTRLEKKSARGGCHAASHDAEYRVYSTMVQLGIP